MIYSKKMVPHSIYLHIPFCRHRCGYCDFNTYAGSEELIPDYVNALCKEIEIIATNAQARIPVHTIFFGGGTPSLLPARQIGVILVSLRQFFEISDGIEVTLEANPGTVSRDYVAELWAMGVNRLSLGMQSANPEELRLLQRQHDFVDVIQAVKWARQAGFSNINLDLIFGLPEQEFETWRRSLELALGLSPPHLSLYALSLEHGTPFGAWARRGMLSEPDPDNAADMYEIASEILCKNGYAHYEISNWARYSLSGDSFACRHNLQYWRNLPYLGFGAGAHGFAGGFRAANILSPQVYIKKLLDYQKEYLSSGVSVLFQSDFPMSPATATSKEVGRQEEIAETMMMGLRLVQEGISAKGFARRFGLSLIEAFNDTITRLVRLGLLEWAGNEKEILRLTPRGRLVGNQVFVEFI